MKETERPSFYAVIPANVRYDKRLTPNAKLLYGEITALCNEKGFCWASNDYFANLYCVSKKSISTWISGLSKNGYISIAFIYKEGTKEIANRYIRILPDPMEENVNTPMEENVKDNITVFNNTNNNTKEKIQNKTQDQFMIFYQNYPKKTNKTDARKTFNKLIKSGETLDSILSKLTIYKKQIEKDQTDIKYIKNPQRFLNCLEDYETEEEKKPVSEKRICPACGSTLSGLFCKTCFTQYNEKMEATF